MEVAPQGSGPVPPAPAPGPIASGASLSGSVTTSGASMWYTGFTTSSTLVPLPSAPHIAIATQTFLKTDGAAVVSEAARARTSAFSSVAVMGVDASGAAASAT